MNDLTTSLNDLEESIIENEEKYMLIKQDEQRTNEVVKQNTMDNLEWLSAEQIYTSCGTSRQTWENFKKDFLSKSTFTQKDIQERPSRNGGNLYTDSILKQFQLWLKGFKYAKEDICDLCSVSETTFKRFVASSSMTERDFIVLGSSHKRMYNEEVLKQFQTWLMKNQVNQGKSSEVVKQNTMDNLEIGVAANVVMSSGSIEAAEQFAQLLISRTTAIAKTKQLEAENAQLVHALEYDKVKEWKPWSILKNQWKQQFEILRHHINYKELFDEVGLIKDEHYKKKVMGFNKFPTVLVSQEAEDLLFDWLDTNSY